MSHRFMISVATAALIAGTSFASAQGMGGGREGGAAGGGATQQSAPSAAPSGGAMNRDGSAGGMKASESDQKGGATNRSAQQDMKPSAGDKSKGEKSAQDTKGGDRSKSMSSQNDDKGASKGMKAEGQDRNGSMKAEGRDDHNSANRAEGRDNSSSSTKENRTVGQAGAGAKLSTEQRTKITTVIRDQHISPVTNVNFAISVGTRVPRDVGFHPLPADIVTIYPDWRGYEFFLVRDQIVVVDPRSLEIVAVLDA